MRTGRQWDQRMEVMRDSMIYFRNNPSILFWEAGNTVVTVRAHAADGRSAQAVGSRTAGASWARAATTACRQHRDHAHRRVFRRHDRAGSPRPMRWRDRRICSAPTAWSAAIVRR